MSYFATDNYSVVQSVLVSSPSVIPNQILAEGKVLRVDVMVRLSWREDGSVFFTRPRTGVFITWSSNQPTNQKAN
jgi:hypothetical protein